ncbi:menaquinone-dependent protoporphyrinogen IX dehydrogenase [Methylomonas sp. LL1]|uniref:menaquinone-dependent protoporphyrinogen IX dehydrogenase n=1 Tax=Methylomonas sp. LL1 TaxID=2785785 RepID=UPI0018C3FEB8|nr:menaquinone-dependent protoporphyrinogen IX dehydrogenase [Methylomonas sp. LL1]QPK63933.1 menaquinone-dependent protoporphyrinogen IX dehydrogenase [Methylomonas sp. LL1]
MRPRNLSNILIVYSTADGQTLKICQRLRIVIEQRQHKVTLVSIEQAVKLDLSDFDNIVIGASIRYGHHDPRIAEFIESNRQLLDSKPNAFFSVNVVARKPEKSSPETNPYLQKFLRRIRWKPKELAVFAGKIDYPSYRPVDRLVIRLIMWMTKGPTDPSAVIEFTDWEQVAAFGQRLSEM